MQNRSLKTSVSVPVWQLIATALLLYLLPPPETVEIFMLSVLKYKESVLAVKLLIITLVILAPFYFNQRNNRPLSARQRSDLLNTIKNMAEAQYSLHKRNVLARSFEQLLDNEAKRGFTMPTGALAGAVSDLYIADIGVYSKLLEDAAFKTTANINRKSFHLYLSELINEMHIQHCHYMKELYKGFAETYFINMGQKHVDLMINNFAAQADSETKLRTDHLFALNSMETIRTT